MWATGGVDVGREAARRAARQNPEPAAPIRAEHPRTRKQSATMITDTSLYTLAIFLGCAAMLMIVLYHFLEVNAHEGEALSNARKADAVPAAGKARS
ncbi:Oligosaccaryltransferase [Diplodia corticola]|uniref:Dolichyl-diphosphooligosaccharide--protein glycosyltransferase subunit 4 n=1 Tax=Diplodia corticola TaxID=236234 RepID=A0A1J9RB03_9PEZI|nr:Oligosaccaryltransferase [Diplodia corticola]OJD37657.1 Oligosaccaryltransferase [Diplodia corticola]